MRRILASALVCLMGPILADAALAQDRPIDLSSKGTNVFTASGGQTLTLPSQAAPSAVVGAFLRTQGHFPETIASLVVTSENRVARTGITHLRLAQEVEGLTVYGTYVKAAVNDAGELVHLIENLAPPPAGGLLRTAIDERAALDAALDEVHPGVFVTLAQGPRDGNTVRFSGDDFFYRDPTVTRVAIPMQSGVLQEGYLVETWTQDDNLLHHTLVGGAGRVLRVELRTNNDSYNIFPDHPLNSAQTLTAGPGLGDCGSAVSPESPKGWLFSVDHATVDISGNNAHAYLDTDADNSPDGGGSLVSDGDFLAKADLTKEPEAFPNQDVAVQNLFYFNNVIHDKLYKHGFVESVGNFQEDNCGNGGSGSDSVNAEAQDGSGTDNANFATPSDGSNPRMQMFVWTQTIPKRDGDVDSDIIWHEYCHGLTWRMIGSMSGAMSGAVGEGMSDVCSILSNDNDVVAEYSFDDPNGIRSAPYTNYPRTYGDFTGDSVHFDGEIYAAIGWRLWEIFQANGIPKDTLWDYLVDGMNFTPASPAFEDMRDGILVSVSASGSGHECHVWEAFADFGVGVSASSTVQNRGPFFSTVTVNEAFDMPDECSGGSGVGPITDSDETKNVVDEDASVDTPVGITAHAVDPDGDTVTYSLDHTLFKIDAIMGDVTVDGTLDAETATTHVVTVEAASTDGSMSSTLFTIDVTDVNEDSVGPITDSNSDPNEVAENASVGTSVGITAFAEDPDVSDNVTYSLVPPPASAEGFAIDPNSGVVTVASGFDQPAGDYMVTVDATSTDVSDSQADFPIKVIAASDQTVTLFGSSSNQGRYWTAIMDVQVMSGGTPVEGAVIVGSPDAGQCDQQSCTCTTGPTGLCSLSASGIRKNIGSMVFTVLSVDGVADESSITIFKP